MQLTGTIRKNKPDIPNEFKLASKTVPDSKFCHSENVTLVCHTPKKHKIVLLASTKITTSKIGDKQKPEMILFYNRTKGGTDVFDQLCHSFTTARGTKRWPMRYFFGILDQALVNSRVLLKCKNAENNTANLTVQVYVKNLVMSLVTPHIREKLTNVYLRNDLRNSINLILNEGSRERPEEDRPKFDIRVRCSLCSAKDNKTKMKCPSCLRAMCDTHRAYFCNNCAGDNE